MIEYENKYRKFIRVMSNSKVEEKIEIVRPYPTVYRVRFSDIVCNDKDVAELLQQDINALIHDISKRILQEKK